MATEISGNVSISGIAKQIKLQQRHGNVKVKFSRVSGLRKKSKCWRDMKGNAEELVEVLQKIRKRRDMNRGRQERRRARQVESQGLKSGEGNRCRQRDEEEVQVRSLFNFSLEKVVRLSIMEESYDMCLKVFLSYRPCGLSHDDGRTVERLKFYGVVGCYGIGVRNSNSFEPVFCGRKRYFTSHSDDRENVIKEV
ncbi:hypothetical protein L211DRAFT_837659, partial [Terfezia boudieri ATCC MYA-4762]